MQSFGPLLLLSLGGLGLSLPQSSHTAKVVSVPYQYTYLLPNGFNGNANYTFVNGTDAGSGKINSVLQAATQAPIISYDDEFLDIVGSSPEVTLVAEREEGDDFAYEMGVWVPERNSVWFTSSVSSGVFPPKTYELELSSNKISEVQTSEPVTNPNGGYYYQGKIYIATYPNNQSYPGGVVAVDAKTLEVEMITNSYFGLRYNGQYLESGLVHGLMIVRN
jgi:gluconolactonase